MSTSDNTNKTEQANGKRKFLENTPGSSGLTDRHKKQLGLTTPEGYFSESRDRILADFQQESRPSNTPVISLSPVYRWLIAASVAILFGIGSYVIYTTGSNGISETALELYEPDAIFEDEPFDEVLIRSLFVDESSIDRYLDEYLMSSMFVEMGSSDPPDPILNSLMLEDSALDAYLEDYLLEEMIF